MGSSKRFCLVPKEPEYLHCGVAAHGRGLYVTSKFSPKFNAFCMPGGIASGQPTARMDPYILQENVPSHMLPKFKGSLMTADKSVCLIQAAVLYDNVVEDVLDEENVSKEERLGQGEQEKEVDDKSSTIDSEMDKGEDGKAFDFRWETPLEGVEADWPPTTSAHCNVLEMLGRILASTTKSTAAEVRSLECIIRKVGGETVDVKKQLGNLQHLIQEHGLLADAVQAMLAADSFVQDDLTALQEDIDRFSEELQDFAGLAKVSLEMVLTIISRIRDKANTRH